MDLFPALARAVCSDRGHHGSDALRQSLWLSLQLARDTRGRAPRQPFAVTTATALSARTAAALPATRRAIAQTRRRDSDDGPEAA